VYPGPIRDYDERAPGRDETETATFGLGCFWGPDAQFGAMAGVVRTRVGYAGGTNPDPTYHALGDHTEVVQVDYDPDEVTDADVLARVFRSHDPNRRTRKTQYQNVVFSATPAQRETLESYLDENGLEADAIGTRIEQLTRFYIAEDYHQKYNLRSKRSLMEPFEELGYDDEALRESPAAAKLNGIASGNDVAAAEELGIDQEPPYGTR
jgi:peptide-methionine (S)-S-oxide reductase